MLLLGSGTLASAAEPGGLNPPRPSGFAGLPESVIQSVFAATTPSGKMLSAQQIRPLILHMPLPKKPVGIVGYVRLKIGVFLLTVESDGTVSKVEKLQSNGQRILDDEVIVHVERVGDTSTS